MASNPEQICDFALDTVEKTPVPSVTEKSPWLCGSRASGRLFDGYRVLPTTMETHPLDVYLEGFPRENVLQSVDVFSIYHRTHAFLPNFVACATRTKSPIVKCDICPSRPSRRILRSRSRIVFLRSTVSCCVFLSCLVLSALTLTMSP